MDRIRSRSERKKGREDSIGEEGAERASIESSERREESARNGFEDEDDAGDGVDARDNATTEGKKEGIGFDGK